MRHDRGFTLVELLVVIAIVAVLAVVGMTASRKMVLNANKSKSMNNLRQLVAVSQGFSSENNGAILHESATMINERRREWTEVLFDEVAPEAASLEEKQRDMIAKGLGLFGDNQALKIANGKLPKSGSKSWRTFAYNNQIGSVALDPGQTMEWVAGAAFTHQVENPEKLILFSHTKLNSNNDYTYILQGNDYENERIEFDIYGGSGIVGFFDGHVEMFTKAHFPGPGARNPQTGSPYTDAELNQYYWGRATRIPRS